MYKIYLVEDEKNLNDLLVSYMRKESWEVISFHNGKDALREIRSNDALHLWILDIMLPDTDGFELLREIKTKNPEIPVIFISARDEDLDRILGLELGSDDYLAKPFLTRELIIRVKKLLNRVYVKQTTQETKVNTLYVCDYEIDQLKRVVYASGKMLDLTSKEFDLLLVFIQQIGQAFSREQLLEYVWGNDYFGSDRAVDDLVRRLRRKMPQLRLETMYGYGYRLLIR